jgi:hypothetical protein
LKLGKTLTTATWLARLFSPLYPMLTDATNSLIETVRRDSSTEPEMKAAAQQFFDAVSKSSREQADAALRSLGAHFDLEDGSRAAFLALVCGALIEGGCDPLAIARPLTDRLEALLKSSVTLADACIAQLPKSEDGDEDPNEAFERARAQLIPTMPHENTAWEALNIFWRPAIAAFSVSAEARAAARHLREPATRISEYHEAGHWLQLMLGVLDDEPIVVVEPETKLGILGRISGVVDNFQLNVLLMDGFPKSGLFARRRVAQRVAAIARGDGPQQSNDTVTGVWNLYTWEAIESRGTLPDPGDTDSSKFWIWNEGTPADIPLFDGRRAILLGPASYPRSWQSQRMFSKLRAHLEIEQKLTKDETEDWLRRMLAAKAAD